MSELEPLITNLALILICAGVMMLIFKRPKQPVVLRYIVAGFLASPNMPYTQRLQKQGNSIEKTFTENLTQREQQ